MSVRSAVLLEQIARQVVSKTDARKALRRQFDGARSKYIDACTHLVTLLNALGEAKVNIDQAESNCKGIKAAWIRDGFLAEGRNERERDAIMEGLTETDPQYQEQARVATTLRHAIVTSIEPDIERVKAEMRLSRLDMEMSLSEVKCLAGEEIGYGN